jgi:hypothetical protein
VQTGSTGKGLASNEDMFSVGVLLWHTPSTVPSPLMTSLTHGSTAQSSTSTTLPRGTAASSSCPMACKRSASPACLRLKVSLACLPPRLALLGASQTRTPQTR